MLVYVVASSSFHICHAQETQDASPARTLSFDSGYSLGIKSQRGLWNFGTELEGLGSYGFDFVSKNFWMGNTLLTRAAWGAAAHIGWKRVQYNFFVTNHEYGHGMRLSARGGFPDYRWSDGSNQVTENIFIFFARGFGKYNLGASSAGLTNLSYSVPSDYNAVRAAAGMNNSSLYSEALEDNVLLGSAHALEYQAYVWGKNDTSRYVDTNRDNLEAETGILGDVEAMRNYYDSQNFNISFDKMKLGSQISRWASSTHWAYLLGAIRYVAHGEPTVKPLMIGSIKLPDLSHFLTSQGLSYKLRSGLLSEGTWIPLTLEYVYVGRFTTEFSAGYYSLMALSSNRKGLRGAELFANSRGKAGLKARWDLPVGTGFLTSLGGAFFQAGSLAGEREIARYTTSGSVGYDLWLRLSMMY